MCPPQPLPRRSEELPLPHALAAMMLWPSSLEPWGKVNLSSLRMCVGYFGNSDKRIAKTPWIHPGLCNCRMVFISFYSPNRETKAGVWLWHEEDKDTIHQFSGCVLLFFTASTNYQTEQLEIPWAYCGSQTESTVHHSREHTATGVLLWDSWSRCVKMCFCLTSPA